MRLAGIIGRGACLAMAAAMMAACSHSSKGWKVDGSIQDAPDSAKVSLMRYTVDGWMPVSIIDIDKKGHFSYSSPTAAAHPDIYRLVYDGQSIYFPIDSAETVTVAASADRFDRGYRLSGSPTALAMMRADSLINAAVDADGAAAAVADPALKLAVGNIMLADTVGTVAYYLLNKTVDGMPLFSMDNRADQRMLGAVATKFDMLRPNDPRTADLRRQVFALRNSEVQIAAPEVGYLDLELLDPQGQKLSLSQTVGASGVTVLSFTAYALDNSSAYNAALYDLMEKYASLPLGIYQVSLDDDETLWAQAANVPWAAVRPGLDERPAVMQKYMVDAIPVAFVINANGDITERVTDPTALDAAIARAKR